MDIFREGTAVYSSKKTPRLESLGALHQLLVLGTILGEAFTAVHGPISAGLEGHLGGAAAAVADHFVHLALTAVAAVLTTGGAAGGAAAGLVLEALLGVESLFGSGEHEFIAAFTAGEGLVLIHTGKPPDFYRQTRDTFFQVFLGSAHPSADDE
jgi:hypothetical protein